MELPDTGQTDAHRLPDPLNQKSSLFSLLESPLPPALGTHIAMKQNNKLSCSIVISLNLGHFGLPKQQVDLIVLRNTLRILENLPNSPTNIQSTVVYDLRKADLTNITNLIQRNNVLCE